VCPIPKKTQCPCTQKKKTTATKTSEPVPPKTHTENKRNKNKTKDVHDLSKTRKLCGKHSKLPADTLGALQDFYREKDARQKQFEDLKTTAEDDFEQLSIHTLFAEDWNASQFWVS